MHSPGVHKVVALMISLFYLIGLWHRGDKPTFREMRIKLIYCVYFLIFLLSLVVGAIKSENKDNSIFLADIAVGVVVLVIKLWILIFKQNEIIDLLNRVCSFTIRNNDDYHSFNEQLRGFAKFVVAFAIGIMVADTSTTIVSPLLQSEKTLFFEIAFPLDWKRNEAAFWCATFFVVTGVILTFIAIIFSTIIWYLLLTCSLRYDVLGSELKRLGRSNGIPKVKMTEHQKRFIYFEDLKTSIDAHLHLRKLTDELGSYFSNVFLIQFGTSGLCICGSIYSLAFDIGDSPFEQVTLLVVLLYFITDIFMITYFGNEIKLSSNRLSYNLFESDWIEQPPSTKKCVIVFEEYLKKPQELVVGKLYPLTLETFTKILNSAYSMFNILKSFQQ